MPIHPKAKPTMYLCGGYNAPDYAGLSEKMNKSKATKKSQKKTK